MEKSDRFNLHGLEVNFVNRGGRGWILRKLRLPHFLQGRFVIFTGKRDVWYTVVLV